MDKFEQLIDELGGIDIYVDEAFRDKCGDNFYEYEQLEYHMDGFAALCYARMRLYNPRGYFARQERHTEILTAIFYAVKNEFSEDPIVTSVKMVSKYYEFIETNMSPELIAKIISDVVMRYLFNNSSIDIFNISIDADNLELYPRANENSPYLYRPTFVLSNWMQCVISNSSWPYDCGLD